jgi:peptide/nickel transport system substrate-binding protein
MRFIKTTKNIFLGLTLFGFAATNTAMAAKDTDTMSVAAYNKFATLDPFQTSARQMIQVAYLMWDPLVLREPNSGKIIPHVATSWKKIDERTWEFKIRNDVTFHNGNKLTAEAVRFSVMDRVLNSKPKSPRISNFKWVKDVEVIDDTTFRIHSKDPYPLVLEQLNTLFLMDPKSTKENTFEHVQGNPIGSGPYKFVSWAKGSKVTMVRNENYWMKGVPAIKNVVIKIVPEVSTRLAELFSGGVDLSLNLLNDQVPSFKVQPNYEVLNFSILRIDFWQFDSMGRASDTPLKDVRVRRAIAHAIDRKKIVTKLVQQEGYEVNGSTSPYHYGHDASIKGYEYDPKKAKALLVEAGYKDGMKINLWQYASHQKLFNQAAMQMLSKVGITLNLKDYIGNSQQMGKLRRKGKLTGISNLNWGSYNVFDSDMILHPFFDLGSQNNYAGDKELSGWLNNARSSTDPALRKDLYKKAQQRIHNQAYWMPTFGVRRFYGKHKDLDIVAGVDEVPRMQFARWK